MAVLTMQSHSSDHWAEWLSTPARCPTVDDAMPKWAPPTEDQGLCRVKKKQAPHSNVTSWKFDHRFLAWDCEVAGAWNLQKWYKRIPALVDHPTASYI